VLEKNDASEMTSNTGRNEFKSILLRYMIIATIYLSHNVVLSFFSNEEDDKDFADTGSESEVSYYQDLNDVNEYSRREKDGESDEDFSVEVSFSQNGDSMTMTSGLQNSTRPANTESEIDSNPLTIQRSSSAEKPPSLKKTSSYDGPQVEVTRSPSGKSVQWDETVVMKERTQPRRANESALTADEPTKFEISPSAFEKIVEAGCETTVQLAGIAVAAADDMFKTAANAIECRMIEESSRKEAENSGDDIEHGRGIQQPGTYEEVSVISQEAASAKDFIGDLADFLLPVKSLKKHQRRQQKITSLKASNESFSINNRDMESQDDQSAALSIRQVQVPLNDMYQGVPLQRQNSKTDISDVTSSTGPSYGSSYDSRNDRVRKMWSDWEMRQKSFKQFREQQPEDELAQQQSGYSQNASIGRSSVDYSAEERVTRQNSGNSRSSSVGHSTKEKHNASTPSVQKDPRQQPSYDGENSITEAAEEQPDRDDESKSRDSLGRHIWRLMQSPSRSISKRPSKNEDKYSASIVHRSSSLSSVSVPDGMKSSSDGLHIPMPAAYNSISGSSKRSAHDVTKTSAVSRPSPSPKNTQPIGYSSVPALDKSPSQSSNVSAPSVAKNTPPLPVDASDNVVTRTPSTSSSVSFPRAAAESSSWEETQSQAPPGTVKNLLSYWKEQEQGLVMTPNVAA